MDEDWAAQPFRSTGHNIFPDGLSTLYLDRDNDLGSYTEANVWARVGHQGGSDPLLAVTDYAG